MKTLQLKDIAGNLPHKLLGQWINPKLNGDTNYYGHIVHIGLASVEYYILNNDDIKPILYPPSDMYKPYIHSGEEIIPIVELAKLACQFSNFKWKLEKNNGNPMAVCGNYGFFYSEVNHCFVEQSNIAVSKICDIKYDLFDFLNELKIDYRGLIQDGLALSVYDLPENPYK
jgi:hypothetical protein